MKFLSKELANTKILNRLDENCQNIFTSMEEEFLEIFLPQSELSVNYA
jgi:hypothetical protein